MMEKIPTLFERDPGTNYRYVRNVVHPACQWVLDGEGIATRKMDGVCVMFDGNRWWTRRDVKSDKATPNGFIPVEEDLATGKIFGWEPAEQSGFHRYLNEALESDAFLTIDRGAPSPTTGTYELIGHRINGNPENIPDHHVIVEHGYTSWKDRPICADSPRNYDSLEKFMQETSWEGIVWHHPDGRRAKLKHKDFPIYGERR